MRKSEINRFESYQLYQYIQQQMNSEDQQNLQQDDGFESINDKLSQKQVDVNNGTCSHYVDQHSPENDEENESQLSPGNSIPNFPKKYSLFPDMVTGWVPKDRRLVPIPITVDIQILDSLYAKIYRQCPNPVKLINEQQPFSFFSSKSANFQMIVCYFGPRYDNTYYAWFQMPFQFPYTNIQPPNNMKFTNRPFSGHHPTLHHIQPNTIIFDSFFENGNLDCVVKVGELEYDLYLRVDSNTRGHFQWFNFKVRNLTKGIKYKFNICNLQKDGSLYNRGMKPYIFSEKAKQKMGRTWGQDGENIKYEKKPSRSLNILFEEFNNWKALTFYKLSFQYSTNYDDDVIQIAYCIPYTYTDLKHYLEQRRKRCQNKRFYHQTRLCFTLGGLPIPLITISDEFTSQQEILPPDPSVSNSYQTINPKAKKKCIVIGCRVHPGQSNSSYILQGLIQFLCSNRNAAKVLRSKIQFKIVPMLNPDGVCFGNYRTGLSGKDFNRQYLNPDVRISPQIYYFKKLVVDYKKKYGNNFMMFLDFHGHSVRKNVFMYGPQNSIMDKYYYQSRIFPRLVNKRTQMFRYYSCIFKIEENKKTTARAIFQKMHNIPLSFTIQASNSSYYDTNTLKDFPFTAQMWNEMGYEIGMSLFQYLNITIAADKARAQKYEKISKYHNSGLEESNLRTTKILQRKRQKKKGGERLEDFQYGRVVKYTETDGDDDLFKYIFQEIQRSEVNKKGKMEPRQAHEREKLFQNQQEIFEGESDNQSESNNLEPEKLALLYKAIKKKKAQSNFEELKKEDQKTLTNRSPEKQLIEKFSNQMIQGRAKSAYGVYQEQYCRRLAQPRKSNQIIVNFAFPLHQTQTESMHISSLRGRLLQNSKKKNPKAFKDFVVQYQKWEKDQKQSNSNTKGIVTRPMSALQKNTVMGTTQATLNNIQSSHKKLIKQQNRENKKSIVIDLPKPRPGPVRRKINLSSDIARQKIEDNKGKNKMFSPIRNKFF